jgi:hypothetical protein
VNIQPSFIPIMEDYSRPWTNEDLCNHFGVTKKEWKEIEKILGDIS